MDYDDIKIGGNEVNMSNSNVLWGEYITTTSQYITTTSQPLFTFASDSVSVVRNGSNTSAGGGGSGGVFESDLIIPLYVVIFVLAIVGNSLVLITLAQNKRMRTVTNVYLLNLVSHFTFVTFFCDLLNLMSSFTLVTFFVLDLLDFVRVFNSLVICFGELRKKSSYCFLFKIKMIGGMRNKSLQKIVLSQ